MKKIIKIGLVSILLFGLSYFLHEGFRLNEKLRVPGLNRLLNPHSGLWKNVDISYHHSDQEIKLIGIDGEINIYYDDRLVPHIFASTTKDAIYAQGYVLAQHRLWQMDFISRLASGRLSEVLGKATIDRDLMMRKYGLEYGAKKAVIEWEQFSDSFVNIDAFKDGINAYINSLDETSLPLEFKLANYKPEVWTNYSSALVSKYLAFTLSRGASDIYNTNAKLLLGEEDYNKLYKQSDPNQIPVIREDVSTPSNLTRTKPEGIDFTKNLVSGYSYKEPAKGLGSNNWAISPSKSKTGNAILANDPHLQLSLPSVWYETHIVTPEINAYGVTVPGIPGIIIGFNENIAYGSTNVGHDVVDYYTIDWIDKSAGTYRVDGEVLTAQRIPQTIKVKNGVDIKWDMLVTIFGPIIWESDDENSSDLAMQWLAHRAPEKPEYNSFIQAMKCKDYDCYKDATSNFFSPAQNFVFADKAGNIGLRVNGDLPVKYKGEGEFLKNGNSKNNMWTEIIPRESNPQSYNPSLGFVSSANQISVSEDYPYPYHGGFEDYRGRRINELLEADKKFDVEDMKKFQLDELSIKAREFLPLFLSQLNQLSFDEHSKKIYKLLNEWDFKYSADSDAAYIFDILTDSFEDNVWDEMVDSAYKVSVPDFWRLYQLMLENPNDEFFDHESTPEIETLNDIVEMTFTEVSKSLSSDEDQNWGAKKTARVMHLINIPAYSKMNLKTGGSGDALKAVRNGFGPSWRMVVELGENPKAWGIYPGGQSGNPLSPFYDNMVDDWAAGEYHQLLFSGDENLIKEKCNIVQNLKPRDE